MENTIENKAKFFAQYTFSVSKLWHSGMEFQYCSIVSLLSRRDKVDEIFNGDDKPELSFWKLPLKSISSITDKDLITLNYSDSYNEMLKGGRVHQIDSFAADVLRSMGYAIPWMGLSVEKQIEFEWIKLM